MDTLQQIFLYILWYIPITKAKRPHLQIASRSNP